MSPIENTNRKEIRMNSEPARIAEIVFLDGNNGEEKKSVYQFVNLVRSDQFVDGSVVTNLDRAGNKPRLKVSFSKPGTYQFSVKCRPDNKNSRYTEGELERNPGFHYQKEKKFYTTEIDGSLILPIDDFFVSPAGKDKYTFEATDAGGQTVSTGNLEVQRLIYYVELKMRSLTSCATHLTTVENEYTKHNIKLIKLPPVEMDYISNIGHEERGIFYKNAKVAYTKSQAVEKQPYSIGIVYTSHLAVKESNFRILHQPVTVGPGCSPALVEIGGEDPVGSWLYYYLWQQLDEKDWFVSARFIKSGGTRADIINIPREKCTTVPIEPGSPKSALVSIDVSTFPHATGTIELIVNIVKAMRAGLASAGVNLICVATVAWWERVDEKEQNQTIVHELGHIIGMVPNGFGKRLDKIPTWYDDTKGHVGDHCFNGLPPNLARYDGDFDQSKIKCVMYGVATDISNFCDNCAPVVCKLDLGGGWWPL